MITCCTENLLGEYNMVEYLTLFAVIQGITESIPVSSSVHYLLLASLCHTAPHPELNVFLHLGSVCAFLVYFHGHVATLFRGVRAFFMGKFHETSCVMLLTLILSTFPAVLGGAFFHFYPPPQTSHSVLALTSIFFGILLYVVDRMAPYTPEKNFPSFKEALLLGCMQVFAFFPGVSRLGICITGGRLLGLSTTASIQWAFLMALPTLSGACVLEVPKLLSSSAFAARFPLWHIFVVTFFCGVATLFVVHRFALIQRFDLFALYRIALAVLLFAITS